MLKSLKNRILLYFLLIALIIACIVFPLNYFQKKKELNIRNTVFELSELHSKFSKDLKVISEFLSFEISNTHFFITGESQYLDKHNSLKDSLQLYLSSKLIRNQLFSPIEKETLQALEGIYKDYCSIIDSMVYLIYQRGYRDLGLEGEMISYIYQVEKTSIIPDRVIFELRKNEREYLNRNEIQYAQLLNRRLDDLLMTIRGRNDLNLIQKNKLEYLLSSYQQGFNRLVALDNQLGIKTNQGLKANLSTEGDLIEAEIDKLLSAARSQEYTQIARMKVLFAILTIILLTSTILVSMFFSKRLVSHLEKLTEYITHLAKHDFSYNSRLNLRKSSKEIRKIYSEFRNMVAQIKIREVQRDEALATATENEKRYRELAELLPQSIFETDRFGNLVYVNKAWYEAFGFTKTDLAEGLNLIEILQTNTSNNLIAISKVENSDYVAIRKDGTRFPALVYADTIKKGDVVSGKRGIIIDATLRNQYIESLKRETIRAITSDKHKSFFLANMSHEIRTPMNSIIGFANLLNNDQIADPQKKEFIQYIQSSGQILLNLIDDIIDIAKIEAGEIKIKNKECKPNQLINELKETFEGYKATLGKEKIQLQSSLPHEEIMFKTDCFRLRQILTNLVSNAIKFTDAGIVTINLKVKNSRFLEFSVEDTGIGLSKEELNSIFSRFKRTAKSEEKNIAGTGLGLSISKNLVELLGGQMWVSSEVGKGTRFWFELPYIRILNQQDASLRKQTSVDSSEYNWSNRTFLIAEDDDSSYVYLRELLKSTRVRLVRAVNGREVVEAVKFSEKIDCILMDIQMPYLDGYEATRQIKKLQPTIPVIAQTAFAMEGDREKSIMAGCDDYITKPVQPGNLLEKIAQFLHDEVTDPSVQTDKSKAHNREESKQQNKSVDKT
jgi:PAS domain S-box-containing protein